MKKIISISILILGFQICLNSMEAPMSSEPSTTKVPSIRRRRRQVRFIKPSSKKLSSEVLAEASWDALPKEIQSYILTLVIGESHYLTKAFKKLIKLSEVNKNFMNLLKQPKFIHDLVIDYMKFNHSSWNDIKQELKINAVGKEFWMLKIILSAGIDEINPNIQFKDESTFLHWAVFYRDINFVKFLLNLGANPNIKDFKNDKPLDIAIKRNKQHGGYDEIIDLLIRYNHTN